MKSKDSQNGLAAPTSGDAVALQPEHASAPAQPDPTGRSGFRIRLLIAGGTMCFGFVFAELTLRLFVPVTDVPFWFWDPVVGTRRKPHQKGVHVSRHAARGAYHFNAQGWNYPRDFEFARRPDTLRVCIVGDSYVEALHVGSEAQLAVVAERTLAERGIRAECYPFGASGFGTASEYRLIRHYVTDYKPDVVLLYFVQNDVHDSSPYLLGIEDYLPCFSLDDQGELVPMPATPWKPSQLRIALTRLALYRYFTIQNRLLTTNRRPMGAGGMHRRASANCSPERFIGADMSMEERGARSWELIETLLSASKAECEEAGAAFAVVYRGNLAAIEAAEAGAAYSPPPKSDDPFCIEERNDLMGAEFLEPICRRRNIPYLDMTETHIDWFKRTGQPHNFDDDDHYNAAGHEAAGRRIAEWIVELQAAGFVSTRNDPKPSEPSRTDSEQSLKADEESGRTEGN